MQQAHVHVCFLHVMRVWVCLQSTHTMLGLNFVLMLQAIIKICTSLTLHSLTSSTGVACILGQSKDEAE